MVYAHYPKYKEHSSAVLRLIFMIWKDSMTYPDLVCDVRGHQPQRNIAFRFNICGSATHIDCTSQSDL